MKKQQLVTDQQIYRIKNIKNLHGEVWKPMVGHEELFHISNIGRVKRLRGYAVSNRLNKKTGKPYKQTVLKIKETIWRGTLNKKNYVSLHLSYNIDLSQTSKIKKKSILVHREVAKAFIPNPNNLPQINHINGNSYDNTVTNLEWCDNSYNQYHRYVILNKEKTIINTNKERIVKVHKLNRFGDIIKTYESITEAALENNTYISNICKVDRGERKTAGGFGWCVDKKSRQNRYRHDGKKRGISRKKTKRQYIYIIS